MRSLSVFLLLAAAGLGWLSIGDRASPLALMVVEWETRLGFFFYQPLALFGLVGLAFSLIPKRSPPPPRRRPTSHSTAAPTGTYPQGSRWAPAVFQAAGAQRLPCG